MHRRTYWALLYVLTCLLHEGAEQAPSGKATAEIRPLLIAPGQLPEPLQTLKWHFVCKPLPTTAIPALRPELTAIPTG